MTDIHANVAQALNITKDQARAITFNACFGIGREGMQKLVNSKEDTSPSPVPGSIVTRSIHRKPIKKKKETKSKKVIPHRVFISGTTSWAKGPAIKKAISKLGAVEFFVTGTSRGAEQLATRICKDMRKPVYVAHPIDGDSDPYIVYGVAAKIFKPTIAIVFNDHPKGNEATQPFEKLMKRLKIDMYYVDKSGNAVLR